MQKKRVYLLALSLCVIRSSFLNARPYFSPTSYSSNQAVEVGSSNAPDIFGGVSVQISTGTPAILNDSFNGFTRSLHANAKTTNSVVLARNQTIPTERPPHVGEVFFFLICIVDGGVQTGSTRHVGH
jgi:hypothetical protein